MLRDIGRGSAQRALRIAPVILSPRRQTPGSRGPARVSRPRRGPPPQRRACPPTPGGLSLVVSGSDLTLTALARAYARERQSPTASRPCPESPDRCSPLTRRPADRDAQREFRTLAVAPRPLPGQVPPPQGAFGSYRRGGSPRTGSNPPITTPDQWVRGNSVRAWCVPSGRRSARCLSFQRVRPPESRDRAAFGEPWKPVGNLPKNPTERGEKAPLDGRLTPPASQLCAGQRNR